MLKKIIWISAIFSIMLNASTERNGFGEKEYIQCFDEQLSYIKQKNNLFYSSQNNKFLTKENASKDSCKRQYLKTKKNAIVCTKKQDILKTIKNLQANKQHLFASCLVPKEKLSLVISAHAYYYNKLSYFHIKYQDHDLFIPKSSVDVIPETTSKDVKKHMYKSKNYKHTKRKHTKRKHTKRKHTKRKHTKRKHSKRKHSKRKHSKIRNNKYYKHNVRSYTKEQTINHNNNSYTYKCLGSHGDVDISATDDSSISMASDILWRMCQKLKTEDEVCKIRDCYKLIR